MKWNLFSHSTPKIMNLDQDDQIMQYKILKMNVENRCQDKKQRVNQQINNINWQDIDSKNQQLQQLSNTHKATFNKIKNQIKQLEKLGIDVNQLNTNLQDESQQAQQIQDQINTIYTSYQEAFDNVIETSHKVEDLKKQFQKMQQDQIQQLQQTESIINHSNLQSEIIFLEQQIQRLNQDFNNKSFKLNQMSQKLHDLGLRAVSYGYEPSGKFIKTVTHQDFNENYGRITTMRQEAQYQKEQFDVLANRLEALKNSQCVESEQQEIVAENNRLNDIDYQLKIELKNAMSKYEDSQKQFQQLLSNLDNRKSQYDQKLIEYNDLIQRQLAEKGMKIQEFQNVKQQHSKQKTILEDKKNKFAQQFDWQYYIQYIHTEDDKLNDDQNFEEQLNSINDNRIMQVDEAYQRFKQNE